jgi:mono/diheme cytochrome c family protein
MDKLPKGLLGRLGAVGTVAVVAVALFTAGALGRGVASTPNLAEGLSLFTTKGCSACHTFETARATGKIGPNLDSVKLTLAQITTQVTKGGCAVLTKTQCAKYKFSMSAFGKTLTKVEIADVAAYVYTDRGKAPSPAKTTTTTTKTATTSTTTSKTTTPVSTTPVSTPPVSTVPVTTTPAGEEPYPNNTDVSCPPGTTINTSGNSDNDDDETGQGPSDGDGCI